MRGKAAFAIAAVLAAVSMLSACIPHRQAVVVVPEVRGQVRDGVSGSPLSAVAVDVAWHGTLGAVHTEPVLSAEDGTFLLPLHREPHTTWRLPTVGGVYRSHVLLRARHADYPDGFTQVGYVFPLQEQVEDSLILLLRDLAPVPDAVSACAPEPHELHAYTLALMLDELVQMEWFRTMLAEFEQRGDALTESLDTTLRAWSVRCELPLDFRTQLMQSYRPLLPRLPDATNR
jgi:hypothetical protein